MSDRDHPTTRPPPRNMTKVTVYRDVAGVWQLTNEPESVAVEAELASGYRVGEDLGGQPCVFGASGTLGMSADEAVRHGVIEIPAVSSQ